MTREEKIAQLAGKALDAETPEAKDNYLRQIVRYAVMPQHEYVLRAVLSNKDNPVSKGLRQVVSNMEG